MSRSAESRVTDILDAIARCEDYLPTLGGQDRVLARMAEDAIERNLQVIGEAVAALPPSVTEAHPEIPWPQIRGFRNILVHQYFGVDTDTVRDVVEHHLPPLRVALTTS